MPRHYDASADEPGRHPRDSLLAAYLDGELTDDERAQVEAHVEQCNVCRRALADVVQLLDSPGDAPARPAPPVAARRRRIPWLGLGIALAASIGAIMVMRQPTPFGEDMEGRTRDAAPTRVDERTPRLEAVLPANGSASAAARPVFTWRRADVDRYSFRLLAEDGAPIWSRDTADTTLTLPSDVRLEPGRSYYWRVDALAAGIVASTRAQQFTVAP